MKRKSIQLFVLAVFTYFVSVPAFAQFVPDSSNGVTTAEQIKDAKHESLVVLEGRITKHLKEEYYEFSDATGSARVEIDDKVWNGVEVRPSDKVKLTGRVDMNALLQRYIEVAKVEKLNN